MEERELEEEEGRSQKQHKERERREEGEKGWKWPLSLKPEEIRKSWWIFAFSRVVVSVKTRHENHLIREGS